MNNASLNFVLISQELLDVVVRKDMRSNKESVVHAVLAVDYVMKESQCVLCNFFFIVISG